MAEVRIGQCEFGQGVFAEEYIAPGQEIILFDGDIITNEQTLEKTGRHRGDPVQVGPDAYIDIGEPARSVNHSCNPNAGLLDDKVLVAIQDIRKGEQIFFDYSTTMDEDQWTLDCRCGEELCRGVVRDFKHLPTKIQKKYIDLGVVQSFIADKYR